MDPNMTLIELLVHAYAVQSDDNPTTEREDRMAELVIALNDWIVGGGFLPINWQFPRSR